MSGYRLHPEALADLNEIWEFIADDNIDAADRVIAEIFDAIRSLVAFPYLAGSSAARFDFDIRSTTVSACARFSGRIRFRGKAVVGGRGCT